MTRSTKGSSSRSSVTTPAAAALARRAAAAGDVSLLRKLEPVVDLVTAVDPVTKDSALHEAARRGRVEAWKFLTGLPGAGDKLFNLYWQRPCALSTAATVPVAGRMGILRLREPPDCDDELIAAAGDDTDATSTAESSIAGSASLHGSGAAGAAGGHPASFLDVEGSLPRLGGVLQRAAATGLLRPLTGCCIWAAVRLNCCGR